MDVRVPLSRALPWGRHEARHLDGCRSWQGRAPSSVSFSGLNFDCTLGFPGEAFWLRGIPPTPASLGLLVPPPSDTTYAGQASDGQRVRIRAAGVTFGGSDGSGGPRATDVRLRRVGWAWAIVDEDGCLYAGASGGLNGNDGQTVPRAELYGLYHLVAHVDATSPLRVAIDNKYVVDSLLAMKTGWRPAAGTVNGDLLALIAAQFDAGWCANLEFVKITSHKTLEEALAAGSHRLEWWANHRADGLAGKAADRHQYCKDDLRVVDCIDAATAMVLRRLMACARFVLERQGKEAVRSPRCPKAPLRQRLAEAAVVAGHELHIGPRGARCRKCMRRSGMRRALGWVGQPCTGPEAGVGHRLRVIHGLRFCTVCGRWDRIAGGSARGEGLRAACPRKAPVHGKRVARRLLAACPRPPVWFTTWPDGSPIAPLVQSGRKRRRQD